MPGSTVRPLDPLPSVIPEEDEEEDGNSGAGDGEPTAAKVVPSAPLAADFATPSCPIAPQGFVDPRWRPLECLQTVDVLTIRAEPHACLSPSHLAFVVLTEGESTLLRIEVSLFSLWDRAACFDATIADVSNRVIAHCSMRCHKLLVRLASAPRVATTATLVPSSPASTTGPVIGSIAVKPWSLRPKIAITDPAKRTLMRISGPLNRCTLVREVEFLITSPDSVYRIGSVTCLWNGCCCSRFCTSYDKMELSLPADMRLDSKLLLLASALLIDVRYFE